MNVTTVGIDVAKGVFQVAGANKRGKILFNKKISRKALMEFMATLEVCTVAMEACASSHYWAREFQKLGHTVKLMPPQYVKPYRKYNKNDRADAEAICVAVSRPSILRRPIAWPPATISTGAATGMPCSPGKAGTWRTTV